jgi:hypothetical protein
MNSGTPFGIGQLGRLHATFATAVATALPEVAARFSDPKAVLKALEGKTSVLAAHLEELLAEAIKRMMVLVHRKRVWLMTTARYDPSSLMNRAGLWLYGGYPDLVVPQAKPVEAGTAFVFDEHEIGQPDGAADAEIEGALPEPHLFGETAANAIVAEGIASGYFKKDRAYLLYTPSCVVDVSWFAVESEWRVFAWLRGVSRRGAGSRVLSPAN